MLTGAFSADSSSTWTIAGPAEPIVSSIYPVEPGRAILWGGPSAGITDIHCWTFDAVDGDTRVATEESWAGAPVDANPAAARRLLEGSLDRWLGFLAATATAE